MLGRDDELAALRRFLEAPLPAALVVEGEAGIGKTTVFEAGLAAARDLGFSVLACRPAESEIQLSFAGLAALLHGVLDEILPRCRRRSSALFAWRCSSTTAAVPSGTPSRRRRSRRFGCSHASTRSSSPSTTSSGWTAPPRR